MHKTLEHRRKYTRPAFEHERTFTTTALACPKQDNGSVDEKGSPVCNAQPVRDS